MVKSEKQPFYFLLIILGFSVEFIDSRTVLRLTGIKCVSLDRKLLTVELCQIKAVKRDVTEVSVYTKILQKPIRNMSVVFKVHRRGYEHLRPLLYFDLDFCVFFRNIRHNPIGEMLFGVLDFKKYSNVNHSCPYNHDIIVDKYQFDENKLKMLPFSLGTFTLYTAWTANGARTCNADIQFTIMEK